MEKSKKLKREAKASAENAGHTLGKFRTLVTDGSRMVAEAVCIHCGSYVQINTNPAPNQIDIGGSVFGNSCLVNSEKSNG